MNDQLQAARDEIAFLRSELARLKEAAELIGLALRSAKDVLEEVKKQRTYENKNNIVPGGCVSAPLEVCCVRYVRRMNEVNSNPIAAALVEQARKENANV